MFYLPIHPLDFVYFAVALAIVLAFVLLLREARLRPDSWYRRFDRGAPWQWRSWGFA